MKAVLMSIQPKWCEKICKRIGKDFFGNPKYLKRLDLRKTKPKYETPFKAYIYCTMGETIYLPSDIFGNEALNGKVIGEFVCDYILRHCEMANADIAEEQSCVLREDILKYSNGKEVFGWHISELVIYDKPKELSEFITPTACESRIAKNMMCNTCCLSSEFCSKKPKRITRPPQSWCYVSQIEKGGSE